MLNPAPLESARFGLRVYRAALQQPDAEGLVRELIDTRADLAIIRTPSRIPNALRTLESHGFFAIHADTLVSYECQLSDYQPKALANPHLPIEPARRADRNEILTLVQTVFAKYPNHYHANPLLAADAIVAGYGEWALGHIDGPGEIAWIVRIDGRVVALACSASDASGLCRGTLHGVHPDFAGQGIYTDLIRHTQHYFQERGCHTLRIQTQVGNLPVQRVWAQEGFRFVEVFDTLHVNALLDTDHGNRHHAVLAMPPDTNITPDLSGTATASFLAAAITLATEAGIRAPDMVPGNCNVVIWAPHEGSGDCEVRVRAYPTTFGNDLISATLHNPDGKVCGSARFTLQPSRGKHAHSGAP